MITEAQDRIVRIEVTGGNLRNNNLSVAGLCAFFPRACFGGARRKGGAGKPIRIHLEGLARTVETDIGCDAKTGKPRRQFRGRSWVGDFFRHHGVHSGDVLELERRDEWTYALRVASRSGRATDAPLRFAEFFAGIGLVRLALEKHGFQAVFANDIDIDKFEIYKKNFGEDHFKPGDIHGLSAAEIPDCDLATASFPCTDLSIAGQMNGIHAGESSAFWELVRLLRDMDGRRPPLILLENVPGFLMSHEGKDFESALLALNELGYAVDAIFLDAARFVPQSRLRLFVVGKLGVPGECPWSLGLSELRPRALAEFIGKHPNIRWDIRPVRCPPPQPVSLDTVVQDLPDDDPAWWNADRTNYFMNQLSERHAATAAKRIAARHVSYATAFRRVRNGRSMAELRTDGIAGCLRTPKGGSGRQILFKAGMGQRQVRLLTARECARLQGVPDEYKIDGIPLNQALFGFGDAVCVPVVAWIAQHYLAPLAAELIADRGFSLACRAND